MSFAKHTMGKLVAGIALVMVFAMPASAQEVKIGVVNFPALLEAAPQTKALMDALQEEFAPRQREFLAKQTEFEELQAKVQKEVAVMGETERRNAEKDLRDLQREVGRLQNEFREDLNLRQNEEMGDLQRALLEQVQAYAQQEGYDLIVGDGVLFASGAVNITAAVLQSIEAGYQAQSSAR